MKSYDSNLMMIVNSPADGILGGYGIRLGGAPKCPALGKIKGHCHKVLSRLGSSGSFPRADISLPPLRSGREIDVAEFKPRGRHRTSNAIVLQ